MIVLIMCAVETNRNPEILKSPSLKQEDEPHALTKKISQREENKKFEGMEPPLKKETSSMVYN